MINRQDIITAVNGLLAVAFPTAAVYKNREPVDFVRPSFLIMSPTSRVSTATHSMVEETVYLTITCFGSVDDYGNSDADMLAETQQTAIDLFRAGYISVEDRAVKVSASSGGQDLDRAWVDATCVFNEMRDRNPATEPLMETINTTVKGE